jgi:hypothetical protein
MKDLAGDDLSHRAYQVSAAENAVSQTGSAGA